MALTESQQKVAEDVLSLFKQGKKRVVIKGSAGTGKTYLTNELIKMIRKDLFKWGNICVSAPTHKALAVLKSKIDKNYYIDFKTIHSALMLQQHIVDGKKVFRRKSISSNPKWQPLNDIKLVVLDEGSMVSREIMDYIDEHGDIYFLYIGDPQQLPPVGEEESPVFMGEIIAQYATKEEVPEDFILGRGETMWPNVDGSVTIYKEYPTVCLTEIIRQGEGNPIIDLSRNLERVNSTQDVVTGEGMGYFFDNNRDFIIEKLAEENGSDNLKYLAWTNTDVDKMNHDVRNKIYGQPAKVELGESLIFNSPYLDYTTNEEVKVRTLETAEVILKIPTRETVVQFRDGIGTIADSTPPKYETTQVKIYVINGEIKILHEDHDDEFNYHCKRIKADCVKGLIKWPVYYWFLEYYAQITYNHAITVHKSQGSTYKIAVMNVGNMNLNRDRAERKRLLYTAVTRASQKLCLYNVR